METGQITAQYDLGGDKLFQKRARIALPILVRQAEMAQPIFYADLAAEIGMPNARNLNYVLGAVGSAIQKLSAEMGEELPLINCLVVNQQNHMPGEGIGWFIDRDHFQELPKRKKQALIDGYLARIYAFERWDEVLSALGLSPIPRTTVSTTALEQAGQHYGGGESERHKELKEWVAANPTALGVPGSYRAITEYRLPSGDSIDVLFKGRRHWIGVEVKTSLSSDADVVRGLFQCVKYGAVAEAWQAVSGINADFSTILALESPLPVNLVSLKNALGISVKQCVKEYS